MKKIVIIFCFFVSFASAQEKETVAGIKIGTTIPGTVHAGFLLDHSFNKNIGFTAEALYNQKDVSLSGSTIQYSNSNGLILNERDVKYKIHYLQIPLNLKFTFGDKVRPYVLGGIAAGYVLASSNDAPGKSSMPVYVNNMEWSYLGSIGVDYKPIFIEVRYNASFNPAVYVNPNYVTGTSKWYNRNFMLSVGFKF